MRPLLLIVAHNCPFSATPAKQFDSSWHQRARSLHGFPQTMRWQNDNSCMYANYHVVAAPEDSFDLSRCVDSPSLGSGPLLWSSEAHTWDSEEEGGEQKREITGGKMRSAEEKLKNMASAAKEHADVFEAKLDEKVLNAALKLPMRFFCYTKDHYIWLNKMIIVFSFHLLAKS